MTVIIMAQTQAIIKIILDLLRDRRIMVKRIRKKKKRKENQ